MARGNQFARQWTLLRHLGAGGLAVDDAARRLGCTTRTVWRDLHVLQDGTRQGVFEGGESLVTLREAALSLAECASLPCPSAPVRVRFVTQTRLKEGGAFALRAEFQLLFRRLLGLARDDTRWTRWARYSGRQDRRVEWEGLVGEADSEGDLRAFWPYLAFGQWTHVGSNTTFGLGGYRVQTAAVEAS